MKQRAVLVAAYAAYGIGTGLYLYVAAGHVPEMYRGTAADPAVFMETAVWQQTVRYIFLKNWIYFLLLPLNLLLWWTLLTSGRGARISRKLGAFPSGTRTALYVSILFLLLFAVKLPLRFVSFLVSRSYGVSTQSFAGWWKDHGITYLLDTAFWAAGTLFLFWLIRRGTRRWWFYVWLASVPAILLLFFLRPLVIDPLYNDFSRLQDTGLEQRILQLADQAGIPADRVYEVDMSEKTNALNAYVDGIGSSLRIVLWDTLLESLEEDEILFVMAHEIAHYVLRHLYWNALGAILGAGVILYAGSRLYHYLILRKGAEWGIRSPGDLSALPLILLLVAALNLAALPVSNAISRQAEHAADKYALELTGDGQAAVSAFQKMAEISRSDVHPPLLVKWIRYGHPALSERIRFAERFADRREVAD